MKYYIIAGEASGDLHASNLIKHIFNYDSNAEIRAWGGERMQQEAMSLKTIKTWLLWVLLRLPAI